MSEQSTDQLLRVGCVCDWEVVGTEEIVVPAVIDHGQRVHNMPGTREQVLASAERVVQSPDAGIARASERE
jgi:hypothetical protein